MSLKQKLRSIGIVLVKILQQDLTKYNKWTLIGSWFEEKTVIKDILEKENWTVDVIIEIP